MYRVPRTVPQSQRYLGHLLFMVQRKAYKNKEIILECIKKIGEREAAKEGKEKSREKRRGRERTTSLSKENLGSL